MNTKNNLHNALNKAFESHTEPLYQAQWDRLEGAMAKKKKRRFFPFFLLFTVICITAGSTYFLTLNYGLKTNQTSAFPTKQKSNNKDNVILKNKDIATVIPQKKLSNPTDINSISTLSSTKIIKTKTTKESSPNQNPDITFGDKYYQPTLPELTTPSPNSESTAPVKDIVIDKPEKEDKFESVEVPTDKTEMEISSKNKDNTNPGKKDKDDGNKTPASKFAFSFAAMGYGKLNVKVSGIENSEMLHKDTRKIFEESNRNIKTEFVGFGFDWNIFPRYKIGFNTGLQYLRLATPQNINYTLTEVPFWDRTHTQIEGYVPDTTDPLHFNSSTTNYTTYITIPLRFNYSIPINPKNEILVTGGVNLSTLVSAKGQSVTINKELNREPGVKSLNGQDYRRFNPGFTGGFQYNLKFKDSWWIGLESLYQINPMKYKTGYGSIKNTLDGYIINAIIKYKI